MHARSDFFIGSALRSCSHRGSTTGPIISGRTQDILATDIQAATTLSKLDCDARWTSGIEVISRDGNSLHVEQPAPSNYIAMVRVRGNWQVGRVVLVHPRY